MAAGIPDRVDVAIVGGGLAGTASAWACSQRNRSVALFEQFAFGHDRGSSHGSARIFRRVYADGLYVRLTGAARELWTEVESQAGVPLLRVTGGIDHGPARDVAGITRLLADARVEHELLGPAEAQRRWPGMRFSGPVLFHPQAGVIDADRAVQAFADSARARGAVLADRTPVLQIRPAGDEVVVRTEDRTVHARRVVVAAGAWVGELLAGVLRLPALQVTQQEIFHFAYADSVAGWPTFVHDSGDITAYGLPGGRDGGPGGAQKLGEHAPGTPTTAKTRNGVVDPAARDRIVSYVRRWLPGLIPEPFNEKSCLYTWTANEDFLLDRIGPVIVCSPCSGHGAKFAPLIGELVADLVTGGEPGPARFRLPG